jgi:predicted  nucleic acid-binding Zn-ribbon protein
MTDANAMQIQTIKPNNPLKQQKGKRQMHLVHVKQQLEHAQAAIFITKARQSKITTSLPRFQKRLDKAQGQVKLWSAKSCNNKSSPETKALAAVRLGKATQEVELMKQRIAAAKSRLVHINKVASQRDKRVDDFKAKLKDSKNSIHRKKRQNESIASPSATTAAIGEGNAASVDGGRSRVPMASTSRAFMSVASLRDCVMM